MIFGLLFFENPELSTEPHSSTVRFFYGGRTGVGTFQKLPVGIRWVSNLTPPQQQKARLGDSVLDHRFLGPSLHAIAAELGYKDCFKAFDALAEILMRTIDLMQLIAPGEIREKTIARHIAAYNKGSEAPSIPIPAEQRQRYALMAHSSKFGSDPLDAELIPLAAFRPEHTDRVLTNAIPDEAHLKFELSANIKPDEEWILCRYTTKPVDPLAQLGFFGDEFWVLPVEQAEFLGDPLEYLVCNRVVRADTSNTSVTALDEAGDTRKVTAGNITLMGKTALSHAGGLICDARIRAVAGTQTARACFILARERAITLGYARAVSKAIITNGLENELKVVGWRQGTVWLSSNFEDLETQCSIITAVAAAARLLHPVWPEITTKSPRVEAAKSLLKTRDAEQAMLALRVLGRSTESRL